MWNENSEKWQSEYLEKNLNKNILINCLENNNIILSILNMINKCLNNIPI